MARMVPEKLHESGVGITDHSQSLIESFAGDWDKEWFTFEETGDWPYRTFKLHDPQWLAPLMATLDLDVQVDEPNHLIVSIGDSSADILLVGGPAWQHISLHPGNFVNLVSGVPLSEWGAIAEFSLGPLATANKNGQPVQIGGPWHGGRPKFHNLQWQATHASGVAP